MTETQTEWVRAQVAKAPPLPESVVRLVGERLLRQPPTTQANQKAA